MRALSFAAYRLLASGFFRRHPFRLGALAGLLLFPGLAGEGPSTGGLFLRLLFFCFLSGFFAWGAARWTRLGQRRWPSAFRFHLPILATVPVLAIPAQGSGALRILFTAVLSILYLYFVSRTALRRGPRLRDGRIALKWMTLALGAFVTLALGVVFLAGGS